MNTAQAIETFTPPYASKVELEDAVAQWDFSPPDAVIRFEEKLAREQCWTHGKALEVVAE
jgi:hypothetical protein